MARAASASASVSLRSRRRRRWLPTWKELLVVALAVGLGALAAWLTRPGGVIELGSGAVAASAGAASPLPSGSLLSGSPPASAVVGPN